MIGAMAKQPPRCCLAQTWCLQSITHSTQEVCSLFLSPPPSLSPLSLFSLTHSLSLPPHPLCLPTYLSCLYVPPSFLSLSLYIRILCNYTSLVSVTLTMETCVSEHVGDLMHSLHHLISFVSQMPRVRRHVLNQCYTINYDYFLLQAATTCIST